VKAVVLVGGFGTRLRPLTLSTPKQMLPVVDRPMIEWVIEHLGQSGVTDAVLSLGYRPDAFAEAYPEGSCAGVRLHYAVEPEPLDTAGAIRFAARDAAIDERFVVVNGDVLTDFDVASLWRFHEKVGAEGTIHLTPVDDPSRYGVVPIDEDGQVIEFVEKPPADEAPSNWINAGTYVLEPSVVDRIEGDRRVSIERETFPAMVTDSTLYALQDDAYWIDAGTPETYVQAQLDLISGLRGHACEAIDASAAIADDALVAESVVMAGAVIEGGARVEQSIVMDRGLVGSDAVVSHSVVGPDVVIGRAARLDDLTVIGDAVTIDEGAVLSGARVPEAT
jgi:mannose-1-phosphate guanylyltransferase